MIIIIRVDGHTKHLINYCIHTIVSLYGYGRNAII
jgi:hypothetical protein